MRSKFTVDIHNDFIFIKDLDGERSVTNDIELVVDHVAEIAREMLGAPLLCFRLLYMDTEKKVDGIRTCDNRFHSWYHLGCKDFQEGSLNSKGMVIDQTGRLIS